MSEYLAQRLGGAGLNTEPMTQWLNERAAEGWQLITVDDGICYFTRAGAARHETPNSQSQHQGQRAEGREAAQTKDTVVAVRRSHTSNA